MRLYNYTLLTGLALVAGACADDFNSTYVVKTPSDVKKMSELADYLPLKEYVDFSSQPDFKLGAAVDEDAFIKGGVISPLVSSNFTEITAGNAMKYASCVDAKGDMNFGKVMELIEASKAAKVSLFGHTLAWHSQQQNKYLNSLLADREIEGESPKVPQDVVDKSYDFATDNWAEWHGGEGYTIEVANGALTISNPEVREQFWTVQYHGISGVATKPDVEYTVKLTIKGSAEGVLHTKLGDWSTGPSQDISFGTEYEEITVKYSNPIDGTSFLMLQSGDFAGDIFIKKIEVSHVEMIDASPTELREVTESRRCIVVETQDKVKEAWDSQFWFVTKDKFTKGASYSFKAEIRADIAASVGTQVHDAPGDYKHYVGIGNFNFTTEWEEVTMEGTIDTGENELECHSIALNLNDFAKANKYYFDNISLKINGVEQIVNGDCEGSDVSSFVKKEYPVTDPEDASISDKITYKKLFKLNTMPIPAEEKKEILINELDKWIDGMMAACDGYVTSWDVVNEAISGDYAHLVDGKYYPLQHASNVSEDDAKNNFYWQDYLGDVDYVRTAVASARKHFAEHNGDAGKLKLFINDYNLEAAYDDNRKAKSLVYWIEKWEADGVTKIDGVASQMHVSYSMDPNIQKKNEECVVKMLEILASTGKLVKISELDMGISDESGNKITTAEMTPDKEKLMGEYYKFIVQKYFEIVPAAQRYGITQWCITDSPDNSGWRKGEPTGLWDADYYRKYTYAGFADGLNEAKK